MFQLLRKSWSKHKNKAHITWAQSSMARTATRVGQLLRRELWLRPLVAIVILGTIGFGVRRAIESTMKEHLQSELQTLLNVERSMLETWFQTQEANAISLANDPQIREHIASLVQAAEDSTTAGPANAGSGPQLKRELGPGMAAHDFTGYFVADKSERILTASYPELVGRQNVKAYARFLPRVFEGEATVSAPFASVATIKDEQGQLRTEVPTMYVVAPVRDSSFQIVAALALQIRPEREFTRILQLGQIGKSGETYAFNKDGLLVSNSRFDENLILMGLLPDKEYSRSLLNLLIRDPGGNMTVDYRPTKRRHELPMTKMALSATNGESGIDVEGYRDYRGVPVVGAWAWLPKYDIGLTTEQDYDEAYRPLIILQWTFWGLFLLLALSSAAIFIFMMVVSRLQREARKMALEAKQLGQYRLEKQLGKGAMGVVYKAQHAMLRRPTAIKMLDVDKVNEGSIQRFEREVQITCLLNHPNTVSIYDFGRTPEGVFYYAMEYLDGIDLQKLVDDFGPQSEARVVRILTQVCGSLYEAHTRGLVHRDIKPSNIMLNRRGAEPDVVKVLDFGLVKALDDRKQAELTSAGSLTGTPLYMSPEAIQTPNAVDQRGDIYAIAAVGYFLLTGRPVFEAENIVELCRQHVSVLPKPPSQRVGKSFSPELENLLLNCLEKDPSRRPQTARELAQRLARSPYAGHWTLEDAELWWSRIEHDVPAAATPADSTKDLGQTMVQPPEETD